MTTRVSSSFREATAERTHEFVARGHLLRDVFPHRVYHLPKCGPDGFRLAKRMCGIDDPAAMWELVLYADPGTLGEFPGELFFDDDIVWHQQQFGLPGQVASANAVIDGDTIYTMAHVSDLVQRIGRRREHKTRVEKRFGGWRRMLLNAILDFAMERGARTVRTPTAEFALRHTDAARTVRPELFKRIYDGAVAGLVPARREAEWWVIDVAAARDHVVGLARREEQRSRPERITCIYHDTERGLGHGDVDPEFARQADRAAPAALEAMLDVEARIGARTTYGVVGELLGDVRPAIEAGGHGLAFHSFDHQIDREDQLVRCREVDYRLKGYRPPRSELTAELTDRNLLHHNFEWIAGSRGMLGVDVPELSAGLVRLPIFLDDYALHRGDVPYDAWEREALELVAANALTAIGLHDCYAPEWIERYPEFLERVSEFAELWTLDAVAAEVTLAAAG